MDAPGIATKKWAADFWHSQFQSGAGAEALRAWGSPMKMPVEVEQNLQTEALHGLYISHSPEQSLELESPNDAEVARVIWWSGMGEVTHPFPPTATQNLIAPPEAAFPVF